ncbi:MAG: hypothetical protein WCB51_05410 [Candidatus Dormiibacterota bacterium]
MHVKVIPGALAAVFLSCSCSSSPAPTTRPTATPSPSVTACPGPQPGDPGYVADPAHDLIVNGSFGDPHIGGHRRVTSIPGWAVVGTVELVASPSCLPFADNQYASLAFGASVAQTVPTTPGTTYTLNVSDTRDGDCSTAGSELDTYWDGRKINSDIALAQGTTPTGGPPSTPWGSYGSEAAPVAAGGSTTEVRIAVADAAVTCRFDVSGIALVVKLRATSAP